MKLFSKKEILILAVLSFAAVLSFLTGFDYYLTKALSNRSSFGVSLFFSYWYYVAFEVVAVTVLLIKSKKAALAVVSSMIVLSLMHAAFTEYAPRQRPAEAMPIGSGLMKLILDFGASSSFFSGHTAGVVAIYTGFMLMGFHPRLVFALILPIISSRITLIHHYASDVIGGAVIAYAVTKAMFKILRWCESYS